MIRVKVFDESHEKDLEDAVNVFLKKIDDSNFVDIKYQAGVSINDDENQIYCFSAMTFIKHKKELDEPALFYALCWDNMCR